MKMYAFDFQSVLPIFNEKNYTLVLINDTLHYKLLEKLVII